MDEKGKKVSIVQRIATLNTGLENARKILAADRVFPVLNKQGHYVVFQPQEGGFYLVDAEGCFIDEQRRIDLIEGSCEHRLALEDLFEEAQEEQGQPAACLSPDWHPQLNPFQTQAGSIAALESPLALALHDLLTPISGIY